MPSVKVTARYGETLLLTTGRTEETVTLTVLAPDDVIQRIVDRHQKTCESAYNIAQWLVAKNWAVLTEIKTVTLIQSLQIEARREP
jgi:hypothetical protein